MSNRKKARGTIVDFEFLHIVNLSNSIMVRKIGATPVNASNIWLSRDQICIHNSKPTPGSPWPTITVSMSDGFAAMKGLIEGVAA